MRRRVIRLIAIIVIILIVFFSIGVLIPANAKPAPRRANVGLNGLVYLSRATLQQRFQSSINQQLPQLKKNALKSLAGNLPPWAAPFADSLLQPSVIVTSLTPQQQGLRANLNVSLYQGDPQPLNVAMLVTFQIKDSNTIQVNGASLPGQPVLITGPLTTLSLPIGQLNSITPTTNCGDTGLMIGLQLPINLANNATNGTTGLSTDPTTTEQTTAVLQQSAADRSYLPLSQHSQSSQQTKSTDSTIQVFQQPQDALPASVEVPYSSLAELANSVGTVQINGSLQAQNLALHVQNGQYVATADIVGNFFGNPTFKLGTATTTIIPTAVNGQLRLNVQNTSIHILFITLPISTFNQQIEQALNNKIGGVLNGRVSVSSANIGPSAQIPCAAATSLLLSGSANLP